MVAQVHLLNQIEQVYLKNTNKQEGTTPNNQGRHKAQTTERERVRQKKIISFCDVGTCWLT